VFRGRRAGPCMIEGVMCDVEAKPVLSMMMMMMMMMMRR
jgi:hypothetical protein